MTTSIFDILKTPYIGQEVHRRATIYNIYEKYYLGNQYNSEFVKRFYRLYAQTREFYSLISRAVDIDVQLVPGKWITTQNQDQVDEILDRSNWLENGSLYVHYGAVFGDFYLRCYEDEDIKIQPLDPRGIWLEPGRAIIARNVVNTQSGLLEEHAEIITTDRVSFFINGRQVNSYRHPFGIVPVFYGQNKSIGKEMGLNSFHNVLDEVNAVNEMVTFLQDQMLRALINQKVVTGAQPTELEWGPDKTIFLPQGASIDTIRGSIDVEGSLALIQDIKAEVKNSLPELIFDSARQLNLERPVSADALAIYSQELIAKINRMRQGYDKTLKQVINTVRIMSGESEIEFDFDPDRPVLEVVQSNVNSTEVAPEQQRQAESAGNEEINGR